jgi:hypothetical protein
MRTCVKDLDRVGRPIYELGAVGSVEIKAPLDLIIVVELCDVWLKVLSPLGL